MVFNSKNRGFGAFEHIEPGLAMFIVKSYDIVLIVVTYQAFITGLHYLTFRYTCDLTDNGWCLTNGRCDEHAINGLSEACWCPL